MVISRVKSAQAGHVEIALNFSLGRSPVSGTLGPSVE